MPEEPEIKSDAVCGNCDKTYKEHYFEDYIYCYEDTNGDTWDEMPREGLLFDIIAERYPDIVMETVLHWRSENGHTEGYNGPETRTVKCSICESEIEAVAKHLTGEDAVCWFCISVHGVEALERSSHA